MFGAARAHAGRMPDISRTTPHGLAAATRRLVDGRGLEGKDRLLGEVAVMVARCADRARIDGDPAGFLRASGRLEVLLDRVLPGGGDGGEGSSVQPGSDDSGGLAGLLGAGPEVCDGSVV